jgi:hypothetical protein
MDAISKTATDLFDDVANWSFARAETCRHVKVFPDELAYCKEHATLALVVRRAHTGGFVLMEAGLNYLIESKERGRTLSLPSPVRGSCRRSHFGSLTPAPLTRCSSASTESLHETAIGGRTGTGWSTQRTEMKIGEEVRSKERSHPQ